MTLIEPSTAELSSWLERRVDFARRDPQRTAVQAEGGSLSFGDLERQVQQLAQQLSAAGAGPGVEVAVCLDRRPAAIAAFLGILRVGAAYLPLDPGSPPTHLAAVLASVPKALILTSVDMQGRLPKTDLRVVVTGDRVENSEDPAPGPIEGTLVGILSG